MYIDNGDPGDSGELHIDINGQEYTEQENFSYAGDALDSVVVPTGDGGDIVYTDTDHSGSADLVTEYDAHGDEVRQAHFDPGSQEWVATTTGADLTDAPEPGSIVVDTVDGAVDVGPATVDSDGDGTPDTAVVHDAAGDTVLYTDTTGDGQADLATEITADGEVVTAEHTGDHEWTEVEQGHLDADGGYHVDSDTPADFAPPVTPGGDGGTDQSTDGADDRFWSAVAARQQSWGASRGVFGDAAGNAPGVVWIDSTTGQWISPN